jgi:hypothetical protein
MKEEIYSTVIGHVSNEKTSAQRRPQYVGEAYEHFAF